MIFFCARKPLTLTYFGEQYALQPLTWPEINLDHLLAAPNGLGLSIVNRHREHLQVIDFDHARLPGFPRRLETHPRNLPEGSRIMMLRDAGIGDAVTMLPVISCLNRLPNSPQPILATLKDRHQILTDADCQLVPLPLRLSQLLGKADFFVDFHDPKNICEKVEMIDFNFDSLNIDPASIPAEEKIPRLSPALASAQDIRTAIDDRAGSFAIKILYAPGASDLLRELPAIFLERLATRHPEAAFFSTAAATVSCRNVFRLDTSASLSAFITAIDHCDALVSADSSAYHLAAALDKPALAVFGPVPASIRSGYYPKVVALDADYRGQTCSSPCLIHGHLFRNAGIPIGREGIRELKAGTRITTFSGQSFSYDPERGCPEMNCCHAANSPCLLNIAESDLQEAFGKLLDLLG